MFTEDGMILRVNFSVFRPRTKMALKFADVFKVMSEEYGTHSMEDGEKVLNELNNDFDNIVPETEGESDIDMNISIDIVENNYEKMSESEIVDFDNIVPENEELSLHDFISSEERKYEKGLLFKDIGDNTDDCSLKKRKYTEVTENEADMDMNIFNDIVENNFEKLSESEIVEDLLNDLLHKVSEQSSLKKPKKKRRLSLQERKERSKNNHPIFSPCKPVTSGSKKGCSKKCSESFSTKRRQEIHDYYWSLNKDKQNIWISHMVETITPIRPRKKTTVPLGLQQIKLYKLFCLNLKVHEQPAMYLIKEGKKLLVINYQMIFQTKLTIIL